MIESEGTRDGGGRRGGGQRETFDKRRILVNVFTTSFAATLLQRGAYFFTQGVLGFSQAQNLWLALLVGVTYVAGASASHRIAARFGERRSALGLLALLVLAHVVLVFFSTSAPLAVLFAAVSALQGSLWPVFESYMSAGETPERLGRVLGRYNLSWALSVPASLALAGPLIASGKPALLFVVAAVLYALVALSCLHFPARPQHLEAGHAARPDAQTLAHYRTLLTSARFAMLVSYILLYVLAPLMPAIMNSVGLGTASAARAASLLDVARVACFIALFAYSGWRGRKSLLVIAIAALPLGFALILFAPSIALVIPGELLFGTAAGFVYTAALYYAQIVQNASVDAGGAHEALIGLGYALGPSAGLIGAALSDNALPGTSAYVRGMSIAILPLVICGSVGALWPILRGRAAGVG